MNYFSYFSEIEDTFIRRRGKHLLLSPMDWALIEQWKERGVPLHVALRGIEHAFDSHESKKRKRSVKSLLYCQEEVDAQYAEWLESRAGGHESTGDEDAASPFSREILVAHLARSREEFSRLFAERSVSHPDELSEVFMRAGDRLAEIEADYASSAAPDTRKLEESLTGVERMLNDALRAATAKEDQVKWITEIKKQLQPYRSHMERDVYDQTVDNLLLKRLREHFGLPRLSLFYL